MAKSLKGTYMTVKRIGERESFEGKALKGKDGKVKVPAGPVAKQAVWVEVHGIVKVMAYGQDVDRLADMDAEAGDEIVFGFKKDPSISLK